MFYDRSEPDFPNWWEAIEKSEADPSGDPGKDPGESDAEPSTGSAETTDASDNTDSRIKDAERSAENRAPRFSEEDEENRPGEPEPEGYAFSAVYDRELVCRVWEFAEKIPGNDPELWRKDEMGSWIYRLDYGRRESEFGWEIFDPGVGRHSQGVYAMRPLQWESFVRHFDALS